MYRYLLTLACLLAVCGCSDSSKAPTTAGGSGTANPADPLGLNKKDKAGDDAASKDDAAADADAKSEVPAQEEEMKEETPAETSKPEEPAAEKPATDEPAAEEKKEEDKEADATDKVTIQKAFQAAQKALQSGDGKGAIAELEKALPDNPDDPNLLLNLAALGQRVAGTNPDGPDYALYQKCGDYLRRAMKADAQLAANPNIGNFAGGVFYNEACALAKTDMPAAALKVLQEAVDLGYKSLDQLEKDDDLASVRALAEFNDFLAKAKETVKIQQQKELDQIFAETKPFDFTFDLTDIEGNGIKLEDLKGKVAIIDIWGTWCPPCRMEIPHFVDLQNKYKEAGLEIVGLNSERGASDEEAVALVKEFHKENKMNYRCALIKNETIEQVPGFQGFPTTLFVDRTGKVRALTVGYKELAVLDGIVTRLLNEKPEGDKPAAEEKPAADAKPAAEEKAAETKPEGTAQ